MKTVKITLAVIVVAAIIVAAVMGYYNITVVPPIEIEIDQSIKIIEDKIDTLKKMPESSFCKKFHDEIKYYIDDDYTNNKLGKTQSENDQLQKNLSSNLYVAYTDKFIKQAFYVFIDSQWDEIKLNFIRTEYQALQKDGNQSGMLEKNTETDEKLNEIKNIIEKYDEITNFTNSCKAFSFEEYENIESTFPISTIESDITRSVAYLNNNLENNYVNICERLKTSLRDVPMILFESHVKYLDSKINHSIGKYIDYKLQREYSKYIYTPLSNEIEQLDNSIYNIDMDSFYAEYNKLKDKLKLEGEKAYVKFNQ